MPVDLAITVPTGLVKILLARRLLFDMVRGNLLQEHSRQFDRSRAAFLLDADSQGAFRLGRSGEGDAVAFSPSTSHVAGQWQHCGCSRWSGRKRKRRGSRHEDDTGSRHLYPRRVWRYRSDRDLAREESAWSKGSSAHAQRSLVPARQRQERGYDQYTGQMDQIGYCVRERNL